MKKRAFIIIVIIVIVLVIAGIVTSYLDSARVRNNMEPKFVIKTISYHGDKVTYWGLGYKVIRYPGVSPNEPFKNNIGVKYGSWFMKYELEETPNNTIKGNRVENMNEIYIIVNNQVLNVELEDNSATNSLKEKLKNEDIIIEAHEYGGFEKVGDLGFSLPKEDTNITTSAGDIVLYQGNQISLFYNSNSWSYTKLGKIQNVGANDLKKILGNGDVTIKFTLYK